METLIFWSFVLLALLATAYVKWTKRRNRQAREDGFSIVVETSIRSFDEDAHRFGGIAYPQFSIEYADADGVITERQIYVYDVRKRRPPHMMDCWCFLRDERRTFRSDRILSARNLATGRPIGDIVRYLRR